MNGRATSLLVAAPFSFTSVMVRRSAICVMMRSRRLLLNFRIRVKCVVVPLLRFKGGYGVVSMD